MAFGTTTSLRKKFWDVYIYCAAAPSPWTNGVANIGTKIGQLDADAMMKLVAGDAQKLATGLEAQLSENGEVNLTIIGDGAGTLFKDNYLALIALVNNSVNIAFIPAGTSTGSFATENVKMSGMFLYPELDIQANQPNKIAVTAKREYAVGTGVSINATDNT